MKLLYVINSSKFFCSHFCHIATYLCKHGIDVTVVCGDDDKKEYLVSLGFNFIHIPMSRSGFSLWNNFTFITRLYSVMKRVNPDNIHFLTIKPVLFGGLISRLFFFKTIKKTIFSITGMGSLYLDGSYKSKIVWFIVEHLYKFVLNSDNSIVVFENDDDLSLFLERKIIKKGKGKIINGAGVDTKKFIPCLEHSPIYLISLVCRLIKDKGVLEYIEAGKILRKRNVNVTLQLVGPFDYDNISSIEPKYVVEADKNGFIRYLGERTDVADIYQSSYAACLPSYREGLSKSLIEAMSCGLPIITSDVPGCRQLTRFENGVAVESQNAVALADAIEHLVRNPSKARAMGENSRKAALEVFDSNIIANNFYEIYTHG